MRNFSALLLFINFAMLGISSCSTQPPNEFPTLGAGFRYSTYGVQGNPPPKYGGAIGEQIAVNFPGAVSETIWIVGNIYGDGIYLNSPVKRMIHSSDVVS